jgi:DNA repair protein RecN (Recombination protein N)
MLIELRIRNLAVIEGLTLQIEPGLNALTGETGAGKSIIVGALALLLGERASVEAVRPGADRALVEGVFDTRTSGDIDALLAENGIPAEDGLLILRREVAVGGRNRAWINGSATTATLVGEVGRRLVDLHGQHEHQTLLRRDEQRAILDAFADSARLAGEVARAHTHLRELDGRRAELDRRYAEVEQRADLLRERACEIEAAALRPGEEEELETEATRLDHAEELARLSGALHDALYASETSITARLGELRRTLDQLLRIDPAAGEWRAALEEALYGLEELGRSAGEYAARIEHDPTRLDMVRRRQDIVFRLKNRFGATIEDVLATGRRARAELDLLDTADLERGQLERARETASRALSDRAALLSEQRRTAAQRLEQSLAAVLPELGMPGARFAIALEPLPAPGAHGAEDVEFRIAVNAGFEPRELARVASGGELSRVMLALKSILADVDRIPTLVFDEIDAGIGGRVAHQVADRLRHVARAHQVFVVTHLPQLAARADHHFVVEKVETAGTTSAALREVNGEERVRELARMLGGDPESAVSLEHAREMLGNPDHHGDRI